MGGILYDKVGSKVSAYGQSVPGWLMEELFTIPKLVGQPHFWAGGFPCSPSLLGMGALACFDADCGTLGYRCGQMRLIEIVASMPKGADVVEHLSRVEHSIRMKAESTSEDQRSSLELSGLEHLLCAQLSWDVSSTA